MYDGLQLNQANFDRFSAGSQKIIDIAHGGTGANNATDALTNLGVPVFSILNYGAVADGDGQGNGTDNTSAIAAAFDAAVAAGGGVVLVPPSGTNIYNAPISIAGDYSNITLLGQDGATFDVTANPSLSHSIQALGTYSEDREFTVQANMGDTTITLDNTADIVPGTILQLSSTIDCLSADVRSGVWENADVAKWRLGNATGSVTDITPYSEFSVVKSVLGNVVTLVERLQWKYPIVPVPTWGPTTVSVARIITPVRNFWVKDLNFTRYDPVQVVDGAHIIMFRFAQNSGMVGGTYNLAQRGGAAGRFYCCIDTLQAVSTTHTVGYDPNVQHDVYNSAKFSGCLRHAVILDDINGSQGADESYLSAQYAPYNTVNMFCNISGKSEGNLDGWTSHGGSYGLTVGPFKAVNCARGFFNRACYATITNVNAYNAWNNTTAMGAFSFGAFGTNVTVSDCNVYGSVVRGIQIDRKVLDEIAPSYVGITFNNVNVYDAPVGAYLAPTVTESNAMTVTVATPGVIAQAGGTGLYYGCAIYFTTTGVLPAPLALNTLYYVKEKLSASTFTISATIGGAAIDITDVGSGVLTGNWTDASDQPCGVSFADCDFVRVTGGVWAQAYWNYVSWIGGSMELTGTTPIGYVGFSNAIGHKVRNTTFVANDPAAIGIQVAVPSGTFGTLVFPTTTYPTIRADFGKFGSQTNTLVGLGRLAFFNATRNLYNTQTGETYSFQLWDCWQTVSAARTSTTQTLTMPLEGSGAGEVLWPVGAEIEIVNNAGSGNVNPVIAAAVGVTINAPQGLVIPFGSRAYLKRFGANTWRLAIVTSAQITGAATIDAAAAIGGSDTLDFVPLLQGLYADTANAGRHFVYKKNRAWVSPVKPTTGLGPQSQYLTPPANSTHEWEPGALWDFSAYTTSGSPTYFRPADGAYGTPLTVSGTLAAGTNTITVGAGQAAGLRFGDRLLLCNTTLLNTLVGAFTLVDAIGLQAAARAETVIVQSVAGDVITTANKRRDTYDTTATPLLYPYQNEPRLKLINPTMVGPGGANDHRAIVAALCRDFQSTGGNLSGFNGTYMMGVFSSLGGFIKDLQMVSTKTPGDAGGGVAICSDTSAFEISGMRTYGGSQMLMFSQSDQFYGIVRDVTVQSNYFYNGFNGISTHNTSECLNILNNEVWNPSSHGLDIRCPKVILRGGLVDGSASAALILRINPNGLNVDGLIGRNCLSGILLQDSNVPEYDYDPGNLTFRNINMENIGGLGSAGAYAFQYSQMRSGANPTLGELLIDDCFATMNDNTIAVNVGGKWTAPKVDVTTEAASGASPSGRSVSFNGGANATFTGSGTGVDTNLTVTGWVSSGGPICPGMTISGTGIGAAVTILSQSSGTTGKNGVYVTSAITSASGICTATPGPGRGPANPINTNIQSSTYAIPIFSNTTGLVTSDTAIEGVTSTRIVTLTADQTLLAVQARSAFSAGEFNNTGAGATLHITLPPATGSSPQQFRFNVTDGDGWRIIAGAGDTIQIETGSASAVAGYIESALAGAGTAPIGSYVSLRSVTSVKWIASVDDPANWVVV